MIYPDLEIYVKGPRPEDLLSSFNESVGIVSQQEVKRGGNETFEMLVGDPPCPCLLICRVNGTYSSIWFNGRDLPWSRDVGCATDCANTFDTEVRCQDPEGDAWLSVQGMRQSVVEW